MEIVQFQMTNIAQFKSTTPNSPISQPALPQKTVLAETIVLERIRNGATETLFLTLPQFGKFPRKR